MMRSPWSLPLRLLLFISWFTGQFIVTSLRVSALIMTPGRQPRPGIVRVELDELSDTEVTLLIALITITPDTLVIAVDREDRGMHVHGMFVAGDADGFRAALRQTHDRLLHGVRRNPDVNRTRKESA
ncbi:MAG: Na+/H+ antiporter subunit E [Salinibacterium sp.]|nr:Na+/H+ antiporter subunit E [Salinibacterium sp.]